MRPSDILSVGQEVEAVVLGVNEEEQNFTRRSPAREDPWDENEKRFTTSAGRSKARFGT